MSFSSRKRNTRQKFEFPHQKLQPVPNQNHLHSQFGLWNLWNQQCSQVENLNWWNQKREFNILGMRSAASSSILLHQVGSLRRWRVSHRHAERSPIGNLTTLLSIKRSYFSSLLLCIKARKEIILARLLEEPEWALLLDRQDCHQTSAQRWNPSGSRPLEMLPAMCRKGNPSQHSSWIPSHLWVCEAAISPPEFQSKANTKDHFYSLISNGVHFVINHQ